mmetsp:Transcript_15793/g.45146  ORF Transcript_15793/g.45146 Transcript_15793/m.45146 type:complete len:257 (-) Transcript_15793:648-1418(-)
MIDLVTRTLLDADFDDTRDTHCFLCLGSRVERCITANLLEPHVQLGTTLRILDADGHHRRPTAEHPPLEERIHLIRIISSLGKVLEKLLGPENKLLLGEKALHLLLEELLSSPVLHHRQNDGRLAGVELREVQGVRAEERGTRQGRGLPVVHLRHRHVSLVSSIQIIRFSDAFQHKLVAKPLLQRDYHPIIIETRRAHPKAEPLLGQGQCNIAPQLEGRLDAVHGRHVIHADGLKSYSLLQGGRHGGPWQEGDVQS